MKDRDEQPDCRSVVVSGLEAGTDRVAAESTSTERDYKTFTERFEDARSVTLSARNALPHGRPRARETWDWENIVRDWFRSPTESFEGFARERFPDDPARARRLAHALSKRSQRDAERSGVTWLEAKVLASARGVEIEQQRSAEERAATLSQARERQDRVFRDVQIYGSRMLARAVEGSTSDPATYPLNPFQLRALVAAMKEAQEGQLIALGVDPRTGARAASRGETGADSTVHLRWEVRYDATGLATCEPMRRLPQPSDYPQFAR